MNAPLPNDARPLPAEDLARVESELGADWEQLRGQAVFVTGGSGAVGRWLLETLAWANDRRRLGATVTVLTRDPDDFARRAPHLTSRADFALVAGDVRDFTFPPGRFPVIIHAAAQVATGKSAAPEVADVIVAGTRRVLALATAAETRRLLFVSSGAVYAAGGDEGGPAAIAEDAPLVAENDPEVAPYAAGKRAAEKLLITAAQASAGLSVVIARGFAFVGPLLPLDGRFALGDFLGAALRHEPIQIAGDGSTVRSYLYAADWAAWLWRMLFRGESGRAYNVGAAEARTLGEVAAAVDRLRGGLGVRIAGVAGAGRAGRGYVPDTGRVVRELGCRETVTFETALLKTLSWQAPDFLKTAPPVR